MIFVTVGTYEVPFDRLLGAVANLPGNEQLVVQHGPSLIRPEAAVCDAYLPFDDVMTRMREARVVITHAGVGSVMASLAVGKRPIVVPRRSTFGEIVDDHQVVFARRLGETGMVEVLDDPAELSQVVADHPSMSDVQPVGSTRLAADISEWIDAQPSAPRSRRRRR